MAATRSNPYHYRLGVSIKGVTPQQVFDELERIRIKNGGSLEPAKVVEEAKPASAPLHSAFEWSNATAARLYRLEQARRVITAVRIVAGDGLPERQCYVHVTVAGSSARTAGTYERQEEVAADTLKAAQYLQELQAQIREAERTLAEFRGVLKKSGDDRVVVLALVASALQAAREGLFRLH